MNDRAKNERRTARAAAWRGLLGPMFWALLLALLLKASVVDAFWIPSGSMEPTLQVVDEILVSKLAYGLRLPFCESALLPLGGPSRGDVVVFANPAGHGPDLVKRVIGLPGETVEVRGKDVFIDGRRLADPWGRVTTIPRPGDWFGPVRVPSGSYFMLGDNRDNSYDSRFWKGAAGGFVPLEQIRGRAFLVLWSFDTQRLLPRWGRFLTPLS